jgi:N-acetylglucosamine malate deacetylase 1
MNILVLAPHPDDETIGCGGALCRHADAGDRIAAVFFTSGELGLKALAREEAWRIRESEARAAARLLGIARLEFFRLPDWALGEHLKKGAALLQPILREERPKLIYLPHPRDWHPDHKAALRLLGLALRGIRLRTPELRAYEIWTPLGEHDHVEDISQVMPRKLRALRAHRSQLGEFNYLRAVRGLNQFRGALAARCPYAEVFQTLELKVRRRAGEATSWSR